MKNITIHSGCKKSPYKILYNRDPPKELRDLNIPEELHHTINRSENLKAFIPDFNIESDNQFEFNLKTDTIMKNQESIETELNFSGTSYFCMKSECRSNIQQKHTLLYLLYNLHRNFKRIKCFLTKSL